MVDMNRPTPMRPMTAGTSVRLKNSSRKKANIPTPSSTSSWLRYLLALDDNAEPFTCSNDPMLETLQKQLASVKLGQPETVTPDVLRPILTNKVIFAVDLVEVGLADKICDMLRSLVAGKGAVRATLQRYLPQ